MTAPEGSARVLAAEALGTLLLVAAVVGSGIMARALTADTGLAVLANTAATGAVLWVLIVTLGPVSGAEFNPAVTLALALAGRRPWRGTGARVAAQVAGAVAGTLLAHAMFGLPLLQTGVAARSGAAQWLSEGVASFGLVLVILGALARGAGAAAPVALWIVAAYWFTASTAFANPAVALARALTASFAGIRPADLPGFMAAELLGAALAVPVARALFGPAPPR